MTLAIGTALQNGNYVVDAFCYEDTLGPTYLATHISSGQVLQIKVLGTRPDQIPEPEMRSHLRDYLQAVNALQHPQIIQDLESFEEGGICYLVMATYAGQPLSRMITAQTSLPPTEAFAILRQIHTVLEALRPVGWTGLALTPDQIWQGPDPAPVLTGFDLPRILADSAADEAKIIPQLARLLYFLLTGVRVETVSNPADRLRQCFPELPPSLEAAISQGLVSPRAPASPDLATWMALLPETLAPSPDVPAQPVDRPPLPKPAAVVVSTPPVGPPQTTQPPTRPTASVSVPMKAPVSKTPKSTGFKRQHGLVLTGLVAALAGLGSGLVLRLQDPVSPGGTSRLSPEQAFPPLPDWHGNEPVAEFDTPYVPDKSTARDSPEVPRHTPSAPEPIETPFRQAPVPFAAPSSSGSEDSVPEAATSDSDVEESVPEDSTPAPEQPGQVEPSQPDLSSPPSPPAPAVAPPSDPAPAPAPLPPPAPSPLETAPPAPAPSFSRTPVPTSAVMTGTP